MKKLVAQIGIKNWKKISKSLVNKTPVQCLHRWTKILKPGLTKGPWSIEEDRKLLEWVRSEGPNKWSQCADYISGRSGKQCRERWFNTLHPEVKKGGWSPEEDYLIFESFSKFGSKWSKIAKELPGRTENSIKNRFYSTLRRISTESKKFKSPLEKTKSHLSFTSCPSLNELLHYFPQALEEKRKLYRESKGELTIDINELKSPPEEKSMTPPQESTDQIFLNKKTSRKHSRITHNINNTINLNVNIDQNLIQGLKPKQNQNNILSLEQTIGNLCGSDIKLSENLFESLETKINKLIENDAKKFDGNDEMNKNKINNINNSNTECYLSLINQLTELEKILQLTKQEIYHSYENSGKAVKTEPTSFNLPIKEEKSNVMSPIEIFNYKGQNLFFNPPTLSYGLPNFPSRMNEESYDLMGLEHLFKFN